MSGHPDDLAALANPRSIASTASPPATSIIVPSAASTMACFQCCETELEAQSMATLLELPLKESKCK